MLEVKNLTQGPIVKQLLNLSLPIMGTSFIQMAYSLTDTAWVGRLGSEEVAAIGTIGILVWMLNSIALLNKVGTEVSVSQSIGANNLEEARKFTSHNVTISLLISVTLALVLFFFAEPIIGIYQLSDTITNQAISYLRIICTALPFIFLSTTFTGIYNASGLSKRPFYISGIGLALNMLLDPLFIFGFGWGTAGAAWATWLAQGCVFLLFVYQLRHKDHLLGGFNFFCRLDKRHSTRIFKLGFPVAMFNTLFSFVNMFLGRSASQAGGHIGLMAMTTGGQIEAITWNTSQGISTALSSFIGQNFAAGEIKRVLKAWQSTLIFGVLFGTCCMLLFHFGGEEVFSLFVPEPTAYRVGGEYLYILAFSQIFTLLEITMQGLFYGIGRTLPPAIISITFNYMRIPLALLFVSWGWGLDGIWWAITISSIVKGVSILSYFLLFKKRLLQIPTPA